MTDNDFMSKFDKAFCNLKSKRIVIYGLSYGTKLILDNFHDYNIIGLMDGYKVNGTLYGKDILSYDDALSRGTDIIIIIARPIIVELIRKRIAAFCLKNNIDVYSADGERLVLDDINTDADHNYFKITKEKLINSIDSYDAISFDIFDTLIMRIALYPSDVFEIMEKKMLGNSRFSNFAKIRSEAELTLLKHKIPTFNEIYHEIQRIMNLTENELQNLKSLELDTERVLIIPREEMVTVFNYAVSSGKKVYLTSDMYHSKQWLCDLLESLGIKGYEEILISCEYNTSKGQELFLRLKERAGYKKLLHIGDSEAFDIEAATRNGVDSFHIFSAYDMLQISSYKELLYSTGSLSNRLMIGMFISNIFNSPFSLYQSKGKGYVTKAYDIGYLFVAPIITQFISWLMHKITEDKIDHILFASRDGYLIHQLYEIAAAELKSIKLPNASYLFTSRIICLIATVYNQKDILNLLSIPFEGEPDAMLLKRFMLPAKEIIDYSKEHFTSIEQYILLHEEKILARAAEIRTQYVNYLNSFKLCCDSNNAFFDFVSSGTCQLALNRLMNTEFKGYYFHHFGSMDIKKKALNIEALYKEEGVLAANSLFMESILTSFEPTFECIDADGNPKYVQEKRTYDELNYILEVHMGIRDYFKQFLSIIGLGDYCYSDLLIPEEMLNFIYNSYTRIDNAVFKNYVIDDEIHNQNLHVSNIYRF